MSAALSCSRLAGVAGLVLGASTALAQPSTYSDVPDRFRVELGGFRVGSNTELKLNNGTGGGTDVAFEQDLALPDNSTRFFVEGYWRIGRRHQVSLSWFHDSREGPVRTAQRDITWGDHVFTASTQVQGRASADYFSGVYRFAVYRNDRFEVGPALGVGHLSIDAGISASGTVSGPAGSTSGSFDRSVSQGQVTGDLGGYVWWWPAKRLLVRGDMRYILIKPEKSEASVTDGRASVTYYVWPKVGIGLQYAYTKFRYDRDVLDTDLGGSLRYRGGQLLASFAF